MGARTFSGDLRAYLADTETRRVWSLAAQDGIISTAGILLGFAGAGASPLTLIIAGTSAIVAGMLTMGGAKWAETAAEREAQLQAVTEEVSDLRLQRDRERADLIEHYMKKGLSSGLATQVADELMLHSPLKAILESEHQIFRMISQADVVISGAGAAIAFGLGAAIPFTLAYYLPIDIEVGMIVFSVLLSLIFVSIVGARAGHMDVRRTILRTLAIGAVTISVSYFVGQIAF